MKTISFKTIASIAILFCSVMIFSCKKTNNDNTNKSRLQVRLTDAPDPSIKEVWIDIKEVRINSQDSSWLTLDGAHPGMYNLLELTGGKDTLLADANIPSGNISQLRLVLGDNNYIVTQEDEKIALTTPSAEQSGLKVQIHQDVDGGQLYKLILDFDAAKSIVKAGNSGKYILKPVIRVISFAPSGGNLQGVVVPDSIRTAVFAINGADTVASTFTDISNGKYWFGDIPAGSYQLSFVPNNTTFNNTEKSVTVVLGQTTTADSVMLQKK